MMTHLLSMALPVLILALAFCGLGFRRALKSTRSRAPAFRVGFAVAAAIFGSFLVANRSTLSIGKLRVQKSARAQLQQAVSPLKLFYIRIGKRDFFLHDARHLDRWLTQKSVPHLYQEVEGAHEWPVWKAAFTDFAPRLFK